MIPHFANHHFTIVTYPTTPGNTKCGLCGAYFYERRKAAAMVHGESQLVGGPIRPSNALTIHICFDCLTAGPEGAADRMRALAEHMRYKAGVLEKPELTEGLPGFNFIADHVSTTPVENWLTAAEIEELSRTN